MANSSMRLKENVGGDFFVDSTCIDCDTCRHIAPSTFRDHGDQSSVYHQPSSPEELKLALMALVSCPTGSIGTGSKPNIQEILNAFPYKISENVYWCGFTSKQSFGAWSYLVLRPETEGGNVLIDSPRFASTLVKNISSLGGIRLMFLTHQDDIADHSKYTEAFNCDRIMHADDGAKRLGIEQVIEGNGELYIDEELLAIPVPGHTRGSMVLLYKNKYLFTGDHLAWSPGRKTLIAFRSATWYSWKEQIRSMERLIKYDFEWVIPGHGRIYNGSKEEAKEHLTRCIEWMKNV
jgi:glyoxylase-like metal-dependent hydrolase (beta-lactamase superfamily II)/ferredoxin